MKFKLVKKIGIALFVVLNLSLVSCATSVSVNVVRPAELDLNGANSIAVLPFRPAMYHGHYEPRRGHRLTILDFFFRFTDINPEEQHAINLLKTEIESGLMNSKYLKLISSDAVESALRNSKPVPADVYLTGEVIDFNVVDKRIENKKKVFVDHSEDDDIDDGKERNAKAAKEEEYIIEVEFKRYVTMEFRYQIVDSKTDEIISFKTVEISDDSFSEKNPRDLPSPYSIIKGKIQSSARQILREIQPYTVTKRLELMSYSSKHPAMKYADALAEDGFVQESYEKFYEIYNEQGIYEAGYNAAMLLEALGQLEEAESLMEEVARKADPKVAKRAVKALYDIRNEIKQAKKLDKQNQDREKNI